MVKEKIFILTPYPKGEGPSQRFRFEQYIDFLESKNFVIKHHSFINRKTWKILYTKGNYHRKFIGILGSFFRRWLLLFKLINAKHIFIHREAAQIGPPIFEWIIAKVLRKKYIFDFDDAIWLPNYSKVNASFQRLKAYWKTKYIVKWANQVTAGNEHLANYAKQYNNNVKIIPTTIDTENYHNKTIDYNKNSDLIIGWTGSHTTTHYLNYLIPLLKDLSQSYNFKFRVISNEPPSFGLPFLDFVKWDKETEISDLTSIDIGVMPLTEDIWSKGKCGFKGLQYMALGIPTIMSPVGVNKTIINHGENGYLASELSEWKYFLTQLLNDAELRKQIGLKGQETVIEKYSVISQKENYLELFR